VTAWTVLGEFIVWKSRKMIRWRKRSYQIEKILILFDNFGCSYRYPSLLEALIHGRKIKMAHNFSIFKRRTDDNLYLNLVGDFDGSSAFELINMLKENLDNNTRVSINTSKVRIVHPFGLQVFDQNFSKLKFYQACVEFSGKNADQINSTLDS
jgi:hypothetical protein